VRVSLCARCLLSSNCSWMCACTLMLSWGAVTHQPSDYAGPLRRSLSHEEALIVGEALQDRLSTAKQVQIVLDVAKDVPEY
jgi:hypothetical protein